MRSDCAHISMWCLLNPELGRASADWARCGEPGSLKERGWKYLCICEDRRWDDLVRTKSLSRVDKRRQNLARFPALACRADCQRRHSAQPASPVLRLADRDKRQILTPHGRGQRIVESKAHLETVGVWKLEDGLRGANSS